MEGLGHAAADIRDALVEEFEDLGATRIALGEGEARIPGQRLHPCADRTLRIALLLQDGVHLGLDLRQLLDAHPVDFVRRHRRRGARAQCPGIIGVPVLELPHAGIAGRAGAVLLQLGDLPVERGRELVPGEQPGPLAEIAIHASGAIGNRGDYAPAGGIAATGQPDLLQALVEQEVGRDHASVRGALQPFGFAVHLLGIAFQPVEIGFAVFGRRNLVIAVEHAWQVEERADILHHHIGGVAPAARGHVAIAEGEALECVGETRLDHVDMGPHRRAQRVHVEPGQVGQPLSQVRRDLRLALDRAVRQLVLQVRPLVLVDAQRGCRLGIIAQHLLGDPVDQRLGRRVIVGQQGAGPGGRAGERERRACAKQQLAASGVHSEFLEAKIFRPVRRRANRSARR